jgi:carbamoylphosphate synthase small subunit
MGVCEPDTRAATLRSREAGAMRAKLSTLETDGQILVEQARRLPRLSRNGRTVEGFRHERYSILSIPYHPEAAPDPRDAAHLFSEFHNLMRKS